jgi:hypothetical protein
MQHGWEFRFADRVYYVGAGNIEVARYLVLQHLRSEGDVRPKKIPESATRFLELADGMLIEARVFEFNMTLHADWTQSLNSPTM